MAGEKPDETPAGEDNGAGEVSLRDQLMAAFDEQETGVAGDGDGAATAGAEGAAAAEGAEKPAEGDGAAGDGRERDEQGRFKPKAEQDAAAAAAAAKKPDAKAAKPDPAKAEADAAAAATAAAAEAKDPKFELGGKMSPADKAMLAEVAKTHPRAAQWLADRHAAMVADHTRKTQAVAELQREYAPVQEMFKPWQQRLKAAGYTESGIIKAWASVEQELISGDPKRQIGIIRNIVQQYGLDKAAIAAELGLTGAAASDAAGAGQGAAAAGDPPKIPPELAPWVKELTETRGAVQGIAKWIEDQKKASADAGERAKADMNARQRAEYDRIGGEIEVFRTATEADGKALAHPYFDDVEQDMSMLAQLARARGEKPTLQQLYDTAVWANPVTRGKAQAAASAAQQAKTSEAARAKAAQARRAGASVTGSPATGQTAPAGKPAKDLSLREQLDAAFDETSNRV